MRRRAPRQKFSFLATLENKALACENIGALEGIRTPNLLIRSQMAAVPALTVPSEMPLNGIFRGLLDGEHAAVQVGTGAARLP